MLPSGKAPVIRSRTGWALVYLKQAGLIQSARRGWYSITKRGLDALTAAPARIDRPYLMQFAEFRDFRARSDAARGAEERESDGTSDDTPASIPPDEALEKAYSRLREDVEAELLDTLKGVTPAFFEQTVIDVLVAMGYGGSRSEAARAIGRSGDGGIDGVIDEDRLGLDVIYVQAKRWENTVGRPELQKFAGALQGQRATKGIFITTSTFTREAEEFARMIGSRIVLVDGVRLASLMFEYGVGVTARNTYTVKSLDGDYFEES
jgi:restriction system protein